MFYSVNLLEFSVCVFGRVSTIYFIPTCFMVEYVQFILCVFALSKNLDFH